VLESADAERVNGISGEKLRCGALGRSTALRGSLDFSRQAISTKTSAKVRPAWHELTSQARHELDAPAMGNRVAERGIANEKPVNRIFQQKLQLHAAIRSCAQQGAVRCWPARHSTRNRCYSHASANASTAFQNNNGEP
jgi:hypothetical protein